MRTLPHSTRREFLKQLGGVGALLSVSPALLTRQALPTRRIPVTDEPLPIVGFGSSKAVLEIPTEGPEPVRDVIRTMLEHGGRVVDTSVRAAEIDAEFAREVLHVPDIHEDIFLATKINTPDAEEGIRQRRQTRRLFGDQVDLIQIESLRGLEDHWPRLREWKEIGETRYVGVTVSNYRNFERLESFIRRDSPDFVHVNYSPMEPRAEERILPLAQDRGMAVIINRPFMNGAYFRRVEGRPLPEWVADFDCRTWAQFSLKYILANPAVTVVLTETTNPAHMIENIEAGHGRFPDAAERRRMLEVVADL